MSNVSALILPFPISLPFRLRFSLRAFILVLLMLIAALLVLYVFQINNLVSESYLIQSCQKEIDKIQKENEKLESSLVARGSLGGIEHLIGELNFEKITKIHYITILENQVVKK